MEMNSTDTAFKLFDKDKDGFITRAEFAKVPKQIFIVSASPNNAQGVQEDDQGTDRGGLCQVRPQRRWQDEQRRVQRTDGIQEIV